MTPATVDRPQPTVPNTTVLSQLLSMWPDVQPQPGEATGGSDPHPDEATWSDWNNWSNWRNKW
jgi:hypothetical protein